MRKLFLIVLGLSLGFSSLMPRAAFASAKTAKEVEAKQKREDGRARQAAIKEQNAAKKAAKKK